MTGKISREISTVGVVGLGTMGAGIAEVLARSGVAVVAVEISEADLERGRANLTGSTDRAVAKGKLSATDRDALLGRVRFAVGLDALNAVDLVIEAVPERLDLKRRLFADLDRICRPDAILATNTSSLSVTDIAVATGRPTRVVGMHFFNPAPVMRLVEVVRTVVTDADVVADIEALCGRLGKVGVTISDRAGFIANALLFGYLNQAVTMVDSGFATREDIDTAMKLGCGLPMGPLTLLDLIGLDTAYQILDTMYRRGGRDRRHAPAPLLRQMVTAGLLGRKSGQGFYGYGQASAPVAAPAGPGQSTSESPGESGARHVATVGVVGSGVMAGRLVEMFTQAGFGVTVMAHGAAGSAGAEGSAAPATMDSLADVDLVVEAVTDELDAKRSVLAALDEICKPGVVVATTTSMLPVIECATATRRPSDVVGLHFPGPALAPASASASALVEVVRTIRTSPETVSTARDACARLGATSVVCGDRAGFIINALMFPYLNDAVKMLEASYATVDDIDHAMTLGCGYPVGPFVLLDAVGLDVALAMQRTLYRESREPGLAPAPLLEQMATAHHPFRSGPQ